MKKSLLLLAVTLAMISCGNRNVGLNISKNADFTADDISIHWCDRNISFGFFDNDKNSSSQSGIGFNINKYNGELWIKKGEVITKIPFFVNEEFRDLDKGDFNKVNFCLNDDRLIIKYEYSELVDRENLKFSTKSVDIGFTIYDSETKKILSGL